MLDTRSSYSPSSQASFEMLRHSLKKVFKTPDEHGRGDRSFDDLLRALDRSEISGGY